MEPRSAVPELRALPSWLLAQASARARAAVAAHLAPLEGHRSEFAMLATLDAAGPLSQADLGRRVGLDPSDVTAAVSDLERRGLVERRADTADRRRNVVSLTPDGTTRLGTLRHAVAAAQDDALAPLTPDQRMTLTTLLTRLVVPGHDEPEVAPRSAT